MSRLKTFFMYFLIVLLFFIFSNVMIKAFLRVSFYDMKSYDIKVENAFVDITEAKASNRNGYIKGTIKNTSNDIIQDKYLKVTLISKNNLDIGEKYIHIDKLEPEQIKKFEITFDYDNVKTFKIEMTDTKPEEVPLIELIKINANDLISNSIK